VHTLRNGRDPRARFGRRVSLHEVGSRLLERGSGPHQLLQRGLDATQDGRHGPGGLWGARRATDGGRGGHEIAALVEELVVRGAWG
jgi:hypothetical protein